MNPKTLAILFIAAGMSACGNSSDPQDKDTSGGMLDKAKSLAEDTADAARDMKDQAANGLDNMVDSARETTGEAIDAVKDTTQEVVDGSKEMATSAMASAGEAMDTAKQATSNMASATIEKGSELTTAAVDGSKALAASAAGATRSAAEKTMSAITPASSDTEASAADLKQGESVYKSSCFACHGSGAAGSPILGDASAWSTRIEQGMDVLTQHAIAGYKGTTGYMPPKGGFTNLSDEEVRNAVHYLVSESR